MNIEDESRNIYGAAGGTVVLDGILNPKLYDQAAFKILWILREAWFDFAWTMLRKEGVYERIGNSPTLQPMVYVTYSILNGFPRWKDMDYIRDNPDMADALRCISYINVKKSVGGTSSYYEEIYHWFKKGEHILKKQICDYAPDVIVGCPPFMRDIFRWDVLRSQPINHGLISFVSDPGKPLLIEAPHPSHRGKREIYVNSIIEVVQAEKTKSVRSAKR